ncbi:MAG TPA: hypothetical protein VF320_11955 [Acidimicrobiales bacterium]
MDEVDGPTHGSRSHEPLLIGIRRRSRRAARAYMVMGLALIPWTVYLAVSLPKRQIDTHYRGAWVGFDLLLVVAIVLTAYYAFRMDDRVQLPAMATATLLLVDAWFDVMTAGGRNATAEALVMALLVEIPAALFSLFLARQVNRHVDQLAAHDRSHHQGA